MVLIELSGTIYEIVYQGDVYQILWPLGKSDIVRGRRLGESGWKKLFDKSDYRTWQHAMGECIGGIFTYGKYQLLEESCKDFKATEYKGEVSYD